MPEDKFIALDISFAARGERHGIANVQRKVWQIFQSNPKLKNLNIKYVCCYGNKDDFRYVEFGIEEAKEDLNKEEAKSGNFLYKLLINSVLIYNFAIYFLYFNFIKILRYKRTNKREFLYKLFAKNEINIFNFVFNLFFNKICRFNDRKNKYESIKNQYSSQKDNVPYKIGNKVDFSKCSALFLNAMVWDQNFTHIFNEKDLHNFKLIVFIHDLIPINKIYFTFVHKKFYHFVNLALRKSDLILTNSNFVTKDIANFARQNSFFKDCKIESLSLSAEGTDFKQQNNNNQNTILNQFYLKQNKYAIIVCTVEPRKNHRLLINIWRELHTRNPNDIMPLVIVGGIGWMMGDLIQELQNDVNMKDYIILSDKVDDETKDALLANARFSLFPSFEEGFGLPIAESLAFGVPCITADNSSLPEAGQGLTEMIDLLDTKKWYETILKYITDDNLIAQKKEQIKNAKLRTWHDFEDDFVNIFIDFINENKI
jgi:glycosyltransferase involved in cell wall biosynthesis